MIRSSALFASLGCVLLAGCGDGMESDLQERLAEKYDAALCFTVRSGAFPIEIAAKDQDTPWINALAAGGLLDRKKAPTARSDTETPGHGTTYLFDLTQHGREALKPGGAFCYGRTVVVKIVGHTAPVMRDGDESLAVQALLRHEVTEHWARHPDLLASGKIKAGEETIEALFVKRDGAGWVLAE